MKSMRCPSSPNYLVPQTNAGSAWNHETGLASFSNDAHYSYNIEQLKAGDRTGKTSDTGTTVTNIPIPNLFSKIKNPAGKLTICDYGFGKSINMYYGYDPTAGVIGQYYIPGGGRFIGGLTKTSNAGTTVTSAANAHYLKDFMQGRHAGVVNALFLDGHVEALSSAEVAKSYYTNNNSKNKFTGMFAKWDQ